MQKKTAYASKCSEDGRDRWSPAASEKIHFFIIAELFRLKILCDAKSVVERQRAGSATAARRS
jgi:hypothetical protein